MKKLLLSLLFLASCTADSGPSRLPEPTGSTVRVPQWEEYCEREGQEDPACQHSN